MSKHILIVDDSKTVRNLVAFIMKKEGFRVTMAEDGLDGLEKLYSAGDVDLIVSDINMPRMDGVEVLRRLKADESLKEIPVMMLTTTDDPREVEACYRIGCNIYITKPVDFLKFSETLKSLGLFLQVVKV